MEIKEYETAQDAILSEILQDEEMKSNETLDLLRFMQHNFTPITKKSISSNVTIKRKWFI